MLFNGLRHLLHILHYYICIVTQVLNLGLGILCQTRIMVNVTYYKLDPELQIITKILSKIYFFERGGGLSILNVYI